MGNFPITLPPFSSPPILVFFFLSLFLRLPNLLLHFAIIFCSLCSSQVLTTHRNQQPKSHQIHTLSPPHSIALSSPNQPTRLSSPLLQIALNLHSPSPLPHFIQALNLKLHAFPLRFALVRNPLPSLKPIDTQYSSAKSKSAAASTCTLT